MNLNINYGYIFFLINCAAVIYSEPKVIHQISDEWIHEKTVLLMN